MIKIDKKTCSLYLAKHTGHAQYAMADSSIPLHFKLNKQIWGLGVGLVFNWANFGKFICKIKSLQNP